MHREDTGSSYQKFDFQPKPVYKQKILDNIDTARSRMSSIPNLSQDYNDLVPQQDT
jgi:hypothetical protein